MIVVMHRPPLKRIETAIKPRPIEPETASEATIALRQLGERIENERIWGPCGAHCTRLQSGEQRAMTEHVATTYTELMQGIQAQVGALGLKLTDFDDLAGFAAGLSGKVFGPSQTKRLGPEKLFDALRAAGLRLKLEIDPEQQAKMRERIAANYLPRSDQQARMGNHASPVSTALMARVFKHFSREGTKARWKNSTPKQRSDHARKIANMRWKARRKEMSKRARQARKAHKTRKSA